MCRDGQWIPSNEFHCKDTEKPSFGETCPPEKTVFADKGNTTALVRWLPVVPIDNSGQFVDLQVSPKVMSPHIFVEGRHTVVYTAKDPSGNTEFCYFKVNVEVVRCPVLNPPENGKLEDGECGNLYGSVCHFKCNKGYEPRGSMKRSCNKSQGKDEGYWTGNASHCEIVKCPSLDNPDHAEKNEYGCNNFTSNYGTTCSFNCKPGYEKVNGTSKRTCKEDGTWSGEQLQCQAVTCVGMNIKSEGLLSYPPECTNSSVALPYATECQFTCKNGYQHHGPGLKTCSQSKKWAPDNNPSCKDVQRPSFQNCPSSTIIEFADRNSTSALASWTVPTATDNSGSISNITHFGKRPGERFSSGEHSIRYLASDETGNVAVCEIKVFILVVRCIPKLPDPAGGIKQCTKDNMYGSECSFQCYTGYTMTGSSSRVCEMNESTSVGYWTGNETKCELVSCPHLATLPNTVQSGCGGGAIPNVFGDRCFIGCKIGYRQINGSYERICQANGTWSGQAPYCQVMHCQPLQDPIKGTVKPQLCKMSPEYQDICQFSCQNGYRLLGEQVATCRRDGTWSVNTTSFCQDVESPSFGLTCPNDIRAYADKAKNYTTVTWDSVTATDNSGVTPNVSLNGVKSIYYKGKHLVMYSARDEAGNTKICKFYVTVEVLQCEILPPPVYGYFVGVCGNVYGSKCRIRCNDGFDMVGSENTTCEAKPGDIIGYWDNPVPSCKVRKCSSLKEPEFGFLYPHMCKLSPVSGTACYFGCKPGFRSINGTSVMHCGNDGKWNQSESSILKCLDITPPTFKSCPSDIRESLSANSSALVNWTIPIAVDNSGTTPLLRVLPHGASPPYTFYENTLIVYTAEDAAGNTKECSFKVTLEDNLGPEVDYCPPDQNITVSTMKTKMSWNSPKFKDNSNSPLNIECSHQSDTYFYWGTWNVYCTAFDNNPSNNPAVCQFTLRLKPNDCEELSAPLNGAKACDDWALGRMCVPFCNEKFDFSKRVYNAVWVCGASGIWIPIERWPDCTKTYSPGDARMGLTLQYYSGNCSLPETQAQIKQNFITILNQSAFNEICRDPVFKDKCKAENVKVTCSTVSGSKRKRRASGIHSRTRRSLVLETTISVDIVVLLNDTSEDGTIQDNILAGLRGIEVAEDISSAVRKAVDNGSFSLSVDGTLFVPDEHSLNITQPKRTCAKGQAYNDGYCLGCYLGTYLNKTLGTCEDCPVGTYQDQVSQETCVMCPPKTSTEETRTYNHSGCIALCKPGSYSPTGMEPCFLCGKGYYQQMEGQRLCNKCGENTTTSEAGSNSSVHCKVPCPPGSFSPTGLAPCSLCSRRYFQPRNESRVCFPCPGTTVTVQPGSKSPQDCVEINECDSNPCTNNSTCADLIGDFLCICQPGYTGKQCEINIDDCQDQPCSNNGTCYDLVNNYTCECSQGYQGFSCEEDIDECVSLPCSNNASCINTPGGFNCQCKPGYTGKLCDTEIDECIMVLCKNGATCRDKINSYECLCAAGYQGNNCEENIDDCASEPCRNEAYCVDGVDSYHCLCPAGFNGTNCEHDIDECVNVDCKNNGSCFDQVNGFRCICPQGFTGKVCEVNIDECVSSPCKNGARCMDEVDGYHCGCKEGFNGPHCENNIDDCASSPCSNNGICHDGLNNFTCVCSPGYTGNSCNLDIDYCASNPCLNNASCFDGLTAFTCHCPDGFNGDQCQYNIDDCHIATCYNGGTCVDGIDEYACTCSAGFSGFNCEINVNECAQNPCLNDGTCTDLINDFQCSCKSGYTGRNCSVDINECLISPCQNNGTCTDDVNSYSCDCIDGFSGQHCEINIDECLRHACGHGSTCRDGISSYTCECPPGFRGRFCETEVDECESFPCLFGGTCHDQVNAFHCACGSGFTGQWCEVNIDDCHSDPCINNGTCTDLVANYSCSCPAGFTGLHCQQTVDYCKDANCSENGICINQVTGFQCKCSTGYYGKYCELQIDECSVEPCFNNATCHDAINSFTCSCIDGYTGLYCEMNIDDCFNNSCQNNATCIDQVSGYSCLCVDGFNGTYCETEINECESNPCENNSTCVDQTPGYKCMCPSRYTGQNCQNLRDVCSSSPCGNGETCHGDNSTGSFNCSCMAGFTGKTCEEDIDDCASQPCTMPNSYCHDLVAGYKCVCYPSHTGDNCDIFLGTNFDLIFKRLTTDDMVLLSDGKSIPSMRSFTIAFFVRAEFTPKSGTLFSYSVPKLPEDVIILSFTETQIHLKIKHEVVRTDFKLADGLWHFLGVVWNGNNGTVSVYIDGLEKEKAGNVLLNDTIFGGGWIVLGQHYLAREKKSDLSTAFVGTLHQVNFWNVPAMADHMWNAAHNCTWPISGSVRGWSSFIPGIKGKVEKRFKTQCKAMDMCTTNCSHYLHCESRQGFYFCTCQAGFTGFHCNINIDECSSSPCVNGKCVDGVNLYECVCDKGYWGTNCEKKIESEGECPKLPDPKSGKKSCKHVFGRIICTMTCNEERSFNSEAITTYTCGPDTKWKWNGIADIDVPTCSKIMSPNEIEHHFSVSFSDIPCGNLRELRDSLEQEVDHTLSAVPGCLNSNGVCKLQGVSVPACGWTSNQKTRRSVANQVKILFSVSVKVADSSSHADDIEEKSEAILFQMQYAVSTGQFNINFNGVNKTADRSSFAHLSFNITCSAGFVSSSDQKGCVACSVGTFHQLSPSSCTPCSRGTYQDKEGQLSCKPCGEGKTTSTRGASLVTDCNKVPPERNQGNKVPLEIILPSVITAVLVITGLALYCRFRNVCATKPTTTMDNASGYSHHNEGFEVFPLNKREIFFQNDGNIVPNCYEVPDSVKRGEEPAYAGPKGIRQQPEF